MHFVLSLCEESVTITSGMVWQFKNDSAASQSNACGSHILCSLYRLNSMNVTQILFNLGATLPTNTEGRVSYLPTEITLMMIHMTADEIVKQYIMHITIQLLDFYWILNAEHRAYNWKCCTKGKIDSILTLVRCENRALKKISLRENNTNKNSQYIDDIITNTLE